MDRVRFGATAGMGCLLLLAMAGCGSGTDIKDTPASFMRLSAIGRAYYLATETLGHPPMNQEEIIPFLKKEGDPQELLRSSVDNQNFVIHWGIDYPTMHAKDRFATVTAYEKEGRNGQRYVLQYTKMVTLASESDLAKMTFPPGAERP